MYFSIRPVWVLRISGLNCGMKISCATNFVYVTTKCYCFCVRNNKMLLFFLNAGTLLPISGLTKYPLHKKEKPGFVLKSTQKVQKVQIQYKRPVFVLYFTKYIGQNAYFSYTGSVFGKSPECVFALWPFLHFTGSFIQLLSCTKTVAIFCEENIVLKLKHATVKNDVVVPCSCVSRCCLFLLTLLLLLLLLLLFSEFACASSI